MIELSKFISAIFFLLAKVAMIVLYINVVIWINSMK